MESLVNSVTKSVSMSDRFNPSHASSPRMPENAVITQGDTERGNTNNMQSSKVYHPMLSKQIEGYKKMPSMLNSGANSVISASGNSVSGMSSGAN